VDAWVKHVQDHREAEHEPDALRAWDGNGAVRLLAQEGDVMYLERCDPGTPLSAVGQDAALDVLIGLLPRLWITVGEPFHTLADEAAWWYPKLPRTHLGDAARAAIDDGSATKALDALVRVSREEHAAANAGGS
jgi:streptomycin 6-kinase